MPAVYIREQQKLIFNNKKTPEPTNMLMVAAAA
jgi:hypothetical protein